MKKQDTTKIEEVISENNTIVTTEDPKKSPSKRSRQLAESSIDLYAVQCGECRKWRLLSTQEEFEDVRSKIIEEPFLCSKKPGVSCENSADIKYDSTRTWVIDRPNLPKTPQGFRRSLVLRKDYSKMDVYYITPLGKKLRTRNEVAAFIKANPKYADVSPESFYFTSPKIMENTIPPNMIVSKKSTPSPSVSNKKKLKKSPASPTSLNLTSLTDHPNSSPSD